MKFTLLGLGLIFSLFLTACKEWGTEGGNPQYQHDNPTPITTSAPTALAETICEKRATCLAIQDPNCMSNTLEQNLMTLELKINPPYQSLKEVIDDQNPNFEVLKNDFNTCTDAIKDTNCTDAINAGVFSANDVNLLHEILRVSNSCSEMFIIKE